MTISTLFLARRAILDVIKASRRASLGTAGVTRDEVDAVASEWGRAEARLEAAESKDM